MRRARRLNLNDRICLRMTGDSESGQLLPFCAANVPTIGAAALGRQGAIVAD
jgi:hypothetical protein